jgi:hypothetical protein
MPMPISMLTPTPIKGRNKYFPKSLCGQLIPSTHLNSVGRRLTVSDGRCQDGTAKMVLARSIPAVPWFFWFNWFATTTKAHGPGHFNEQKSALVWSESLPRSKWTICRDAWLRGALLIQMAPRHVTWRHGNNYANICNYGSTKYSVLRSFFIIAPDNLHITENSTNQVNWTNPVTRYPDTGSACARVRCLPKVLLLPERIKKWLGRHKADDITRLAGNHPGERFDRHGHACGSILSHVRPSEVATDWLGCKQLPRAPTGQLGEERRLIQIDQAGTGTLFSNLVRASASSPRHFFSLLFFPSLPSQNRQYLPAINSSPHAYSPI